MGARQTREHHNEFTALCCLMFMWQGDIWSSYSWHIGDDFLQLQLSWDLIVTTNKELWQFLAAMRNVSHTYVWWPQLSHENMIYSPSKDHFTDLSLIIKWSVNFLLRIARNCFVLFHNKLYMTHWTFLTHSTIKLESNSLFYLILMGVGWPPTHQ